MRKKILIIAVVIVIAVAAGIFFYRSKQSKKIPNTFVVRRADLTQEVSVTGKVKPVKSVSLAFERGGKIARIPATVGAMVKAGQVLATLHTTELQAELQQYTAALEVQRAKLQEALQGTRPEEIAIAETKVTNTKKALADAEANLLRVQEKADVDLMNLYYDVGDVLRDAYTKADDAVNKQVDEFFTNDTSSRPQLTFMTEAQVKIDSEAGRLTIGETLSAFYKLFAAPSSSRDALDADLRSSMDHLAAVRNFLLRLNDTLSAAAGLSASTLSSYKSNLNTALANSNTAIAAINTLQQKIAAQKSSNAQAVTTAVGKVNDARNAVATAEGELLLKKAGTPSEQIAAAKAQVRQAEATVQSSMTEITKASLLAPFDGIITKADMEIGEIIASNVPLIAMISSAQYEIEAFIPEADIAKVVIGDRATVTLDAYGNDVVFAAKVMRSDPAETIIDGVATYRTALQFTKDDERIRSGMTANVAIVTDTRTSVLIVPQRAVHTNNGKKVVRVMRGTVVEDAPVTTGLRASDGNMEILNGVSEGENVVTSNE